MKDNQIEVTSLSDLLRYVELRQKRKTMHSNIQQQELISELQHLVKQGFDLGMNGVTYFEIGE